MEIVHLICGQEKKSWAQFLESFHDFSTLVSNNSNVTPNNHSNSGISHYTNNEDTEFCWAVRYLLTPKGQKGFGTLSLWIYSNVLNWLNWNKKNKKKTGLTYTRVRKCICVTYSMYVTTPRVHISVGKETKSKLTTSGARNSGVPNETRSFSRGLYLQEKRADGYRDR